ncbi:MAG: DUF853 family protein [Spiroplasma ixodetis]|nr:DUF853 family protein [Spiroplasma ixodetis]MBP1526578.1 DUF853 family protein [Spiroplasma ixodetis]MBP1527896.1 DUF853 family protein [Spiroplasma ixodetis]
MMEIFRIWKWIFKFCKFVVALLFLLMTLILFAMPVIVGLYLLPSLLIIQGVYLSIFAFRKKKVDLQIAAIIFTSLLTIVFIGFGIWANPTLNYSFNGFSNILSSMFLIEIKFLPLFVILYLGFDWSIYLLYKKVNKWYEYRKTNYIFVNRFIEVWIWLLIVLKSCSMLDYLMNTRKSVLQTKVQWQKENVLLNDDVALNKEKLNQHTLLIGATGSGKTTTALSIINQLVYKLNQTVIIVDGKGDSDLISKVKVIDSNAFVWTINGDNQYNPFASKSHIVLADKIMSLFDFTEPHYQAVAHNYLLILLESLVNNKIEITLSNIIKYFAINDLKNLIDKQNPKYDYILGFNSQQINGLLSRLSVYNEQLNNSVGLKNDLTKISKNNKVILFSLNSLDYPQLASNMGKLLIQDLKEFASIKPRNQHINLVLDEFNVFANDSIINLINKTRSFYYQCFLCFQTINDLKTNNKDLTDTIFGNTANIIAHNVKDPNSAEYLAKVFGTIKTMKLTRQLDFLNRTRNMGSVRETEEFVFHPNEFKNLGLGVANLKIVNQNVLNQPFTTLKIQIKDYNKDYK